jgi:hypothetical protein
LLNQAFWLSIQMFAETEEAQKGQWIDKRLFNDTLGNFRDIGAGSRDK